MGVRKLEPNGQRFGARVAASAIADAPVSTFDPACLPCPSLPEKVAPDEPTLVERQLPLTSHAMTFRRRGVAE
jgi:hypothetical protein